MTIIRQNLQIIKNRIHELEARYQRPPNSVTLVAITKTQSIDNIRAAIAAGQSAFGENYLQEALEKIMLLHNENIEWHFVGSIQSNKTKKIAEHFSWVHTVHNKKIAARLNQQRPAHLAPLNICLQVNTSHEKTKSGVSPEQTYELAGFCETLPHLKLRGLMTIPTLQATLTEQREEFHQLHLLYQMLNKNNFNLDTLSMGMSADIEAGIAENSTMVRIGNAIFGNIIP